MMKVNKLKVLKQLYSKFVTQAKKLNIISIFETNNSFIHILKLKEIKKFNVIMLVNQFYLNNYTL